MRDRGRQEQTIRRNYPFMSDERYEDGTKNEEESEGLISCQIRLEGENNLKTIKIVATKSC